jgi:hypothetical protein
MQLTHLIGASPLRLRGDARLKPSLSLTAERRLAIPMILVIAGDAVSTVAQP